MKTNTWAALLLTSIAIVAVANQPPVVATAAAVQTQPQRSMRLYVFDCGTLESADPTRYRLKREEVAAVPFSVACFLVVHPKGTLMWDVGAVSDAAWTPTGQPVTHHLVLPDKQERTITLRKPLLTQLTEAGFPARDISFFALSHYHYDHTANANAFARATWLVRKVERDAMFNATAPGTTAPATYEGLRQSKAVIIDRDEHDVFGDGSVVIKAAPGHTPGHQVLYLKLPKTGGIVLSGDLYHYPEERTLHRVPTFDADQEQTVRSRSAIETFLTRTGSTLWIQHDLLANAKLRKSPMYYE